MARPAPLIWTAPALDDLDELIAWIALDNEPAARALAERVMAAVERLRHFALSGRWVPEVGGDSYREVIVAPCRVIYRREKTKILIVYVVRGERRLRPLRLR